MMLYEKFRNSSLDTSPIGLINGPDRSDHVYTPAGAKIIGWSTDHEGMHFCHITGFGEMVFAVDPDAPPGDCIHPVAQNMLQFIALICICRDTSLIAHAYRWSKVYFDIQVASINPGSKTRSVLKALGNIYHPEEINDPHRTITDLQSSFDYARLPLHSKYFEWCPVRPGAPKWRVSFDTGFADFCDKGASSKELSVNRSFRWEKDNWCIPAVYLNEDGIIIDSYLEVSPDELHKFEQKWSHKQEETLSVEDKINRNLDNPLIVSVKGQLTVNNKQVACRKSFELSWNPIADNIWHSRRTLEHYGLDRNKGYLFRRECFPRKGNHNNIRTIEYTLSTKPIYVPGQRFIAPEAGKSITFKHPETHIEHTLTVLSQIREALDPNFLSNHPCCYTRLHYTLTPPIHRDWFHIVDSKPGDPWPGSDQDPKALLADKTPAPGHCAISSFRYTPAKQVQWQMLFRQKLRQDAQVKLLP